MDNFLKFISNEHKSLQTQVKQLQTEVEKLERIKTELFEEVCSLRAKLVDREDEEFEGRVVKEESISPSLVHPLQRHITNDPDQQYDLDGSPIEGNLFKP